MPKTGRTAGKVLTGVRVEPFRGWRMAPERLRDLAGRYATPWGQGGDSWDGVAEETANVLRSWQRSGTLVRENRPAVYAYEQTGPHGDQRGVLASVHLDSRLLPREDVIPERAASIARVMGTGRLNLDPLLLGYPGTGTVSAHLDAIALHRPIAEVLGSDGQRHRLWRITQPAVHAEIAEELARVPALIADGHHRWVAARQLRRELHAAGEGPGPWDLVEALLVDTRRSRIRISPVHRVLPFVDPWSALDAASRAFRITRLHGDITEWLPTLRQTAGRTVAFAAVTEVGTFLLTDPHEGLLADALRRVPAGLHGLHVVVLHHALLGAVWGVPDVPEEIHYEPSPSRAVRRVREQGGVAVLLAPPRQEDLRGVLSAGLRLPRKSTAFGAGPHPGLVLRTFDD